MVVESVLHLLKESPKELLRTRRLPKIACNAKEWIKEIEENLVIPAFILRHLASHANAELRTAVADHKNSPIDLLMFLADDKDADVRFAMAENHNNSLVVLQKLSSDLNPYVSCRAEKTLARLNLAPVILNWYSQVQLPALLA
jgi:hypothetical protein